jgi:hypothetical protein
MKLFAFLFSTAVFAQAGLPAPVIFPYPQESDFAGPGLVVDRGTRILLPEAASDHDVLLGRELSAELSDRFGAAVPMQRVAQVPATGRVIVMGTFMNPLVRQICAQRGLTVDAAKPGTEGYVLQVDARVALVAGSDDAGAFYGLQSLRQLARREGARTQLLGARVRDWPHKPFRGVRLYLPGRDQTGFFKRFLRDFMALYKFNAVIIEMNAAMRFDRHPELNAGWIDFARELNLSRRNRPDGPRGENTDSTHHDTADGAVLEKAEVAEMVRWARQFHIDVIPEIPSLTHSYYLLTRHHELAEIPAAEWPDAYCPSNPKAYELIFDVLDEYIEVIQPRTVHIGHDEWRAPLGVCPLCRTRDPRDLFAEDVRKIHAHLAGKKVGAMMWGDHLMEGLRGKDGVYEMKLPSGEKYQRPGGLTADQVKAGIPKDIVMANWFWQDGLAGQGEGNDELLQGWGFKQIFGNFEPHIQNWARRSARPSVLGGTSSSWAATNEANLGKDLMYQMLGCENLLWSTRWPEFGELNATVQALMPGVRSRLSGREPYSALGDPQASVALPGAAAGTAGAVLRVGAVQFEFGRPDFVMRTPLGATSPSIGIGVDVSSLVFLHACEARARNATAYRLIHDFEDTADLLGHYEVRYEDGFVLTIPVRYGVNVLEAAWTPTARRDEYCYLADPAEVAPGKTFFAYEWANPRLGKVVASVTFHGSSGFKDAMGQELKNNGLLLKALTVVKARPPKSGPRTNTEDPE